MKNRNFILISASLILPFLIPDFTMAGAVIPFALGAMLFFNFYGLESLKFAPRREFFYYPFFSILVFCPAVFFLCRKLPDQTLTGLALLAAAPSAVSSPVMAGIIGADKKLSVMLALISNLLAPAVIAAASFFYIQGNISFNLPSAVYKSAGIILMPLAAAAAAKFIPGTGFIKKISPAASSVLFPMIIFSAVMSSKQSLSRMSPENIMIQALPPLVLCALSFGTGFLLSKNNASAKSLSLSFGHKNTALIIYIISESAHPAAAVPVLFYIIFHHTANSILSFAFGKTTAR